MYPRIFYIIILHIHLYSP